MPEFPGGRDSLIRFITSHMNYPDQALKDGLQGQVLIKFLVDTDGSIKNAEVHQDIGGGCGAEAIRIVKSMPNWLPGMRDGKAAAVTYMIPVSFILEEEQALFTRAPDTFPNFIGGNTARKSYMIQTILNDYDFPWEMLRRYQRGRVTLEFIIEANGDITNVSVLNAAHQEIGAYYKQLYENMPKWNPGYKDGKPIAVKMKLTDDIVTLKRGR